MKEKKQQNEMNEFLTEFGLSEREIQLYLTLLKTGPNTIMNLSRETEIKRSTTHNNIEELIKKGLVSQTNYGERRMVIAEDPDKLHFLLEQEKYKMKKMEENLPNVLTQITNLIPDSKAKTKFEVKYYEGKENVMSIYAEAFASRELRSYVNLSEVLEIMPENGRLFLDAHIKNPSLKIWEIFDRSRMHEGYVTRYTENDKYQYKFTDQSLHLEALDVLMYDGKVVTVTFNKQIQCVVTENQDYYKNSVAIFNFVWSILK